MLFIFWSQHSQSSDFSCSTTPSFFAICLTSDPGRKLSQEDRLIGSARLALSQENVLAEVSGLERGGELTELILGMYQLILKGRSIGELRRAADGVKAESMRDVV